jgi:probable F420-dependent oxidoreductase
VQLGVTFPQIEIGTDPGVVREYAQAAQDLGYDYLLAYDHVLGAGTANRPDWSGPYSADNPFHEPLVLFGYLAGVAPSLALVTGVVILPQRQTALVAKQAAQVDVLCGGRLRLGVGVGWNPVEYEALGERFETRGRRVEEQIEVLRRLWTEPTLSYEGRQHRIDDAGINPLPVQRPIPVWMGATSEVARQRAGRLADGWFPLGQISERQVERLEGVWAAAEAAGRRRQEVGVDGRVDLREVPEEAWADHVDRWRAAGASHLSVNTMGTGLQGIEHVEAIRRFRQAVTAA